MESPMTPSEAIQSRQSELVDVMMQMADRELGTPENEVRQFITGFVALLAAAADGDYRPRDEYLASVIPALRDANMPLSIIIDGMIRVGMSAAAVLDREHLPWVVRFCSEHTREILRIWKAP
jgi:hypothetical protein